MIEFKNHKAAFLWGFMAVFMSFVAAMTYVLLRDGPPAGYSEAMMAAVMGFFWIGGLGGCSFAASKPCVTVRVHVKSAVSVVHRYPFHRVESHAAIDKVKQAWVIESRDDEGDPYFIVRAKFVDGADFDLFENHDRQSCESACARFNTALSGTSTAG